MMKIVSFNGDTINSRQICLLMVCLEAFLIYFNILFAIQFSVSPSLSQLSPAVRLCLYTAIKSARAFDEIQLRGFYVALSLFS